jgi:DNA-binding transcriptional regulator PaaX
MNKILNKIAEELFALAKDLGEMGTEFVFTPYGQLRINKIPRTTYYRKIRQFEKRGLVKKIRKPNGNFYALSAKAKELRRSPRIKINRTDGFSTIIIFDIPEDKHKVRDNFRRYLIKNGYTQIQKSVFISSCQVFRELKEFIEELNIVSNVTIISGRVDHFLKHSSR